MDAPGAQPAPAWEQFADAVLRRHGLRCRLERGTPPRDTAGWFVAEEEADRLLAGLPGLHPACEPDPRLLSELDQTVLNTAASLDRAVGIGAAPVDRLARHAALNPHETQLLAVLAAVELSPQRQRLVAYLQDDVAATRLRLATVHQLGLPVGPSAGRPGRDPVAPAGRLTSMGLVEIAEDGAWGRRGVGLPARLAWHLCGDDSPDPGLPPGTRILAEVPLLVESGQPAALLFVHGADRQSRLLAGLQALGRSGAIRTSTPTTPQQWVAVLREAVLRQLPICLEVSAALAPTAQDWLQHSAFASWVVSSPAELPVESMPERAWSEVPVLDGRPSAQEWQRVLGPDTGGFLLDREQLRLAGSIAPRSADLSVTQRIRRIAAGHLEELARRTSPTRGWDDLVLPGDQTEQLHELTDRHRSRRTVYQDWGFNPASSTGLVALFGGPSGTGKTLAAEVIAGDLGLDLYSIDLSGVVSKYIGETEKNLSRIFDAAVAADLVLFFDEADALFGKRSEVNDAHDRYANIEVAYLLQRLERYDGIVILATNLQRNIDPAFVRRLTFAVDFALPEAPQRRAIWERSLPATAPTRDLDLDLLAENFRISGGVIRNAALGAAFRAAAGGGVITMEQVILALRREFQKAGRLRTPEEFGPYYHLVTGDADAAPAR